MSDDVLITPASRKIEFKDNAGNVDGKIELDANGNLNITSPGGDIGLGDATADVYIGDGTNNVDIVFEQNGEIRGLTGRTLTLGQSDSNVTVTAQNFTANGLSYPTSDGTNGQALTTNGSGTLSFSTVSSSGAYDLNGGRLTIDADGDTYIEASSSGSSLDDYFEITMGGTARWYFSQSYFGPNTGQTSAQLGSSTQPWHIGWINNLYSTTAEFTGDVAILGSLRERAYNLTGTALDPSNGTLQYKTLSANTTFTESFIDGESITLMIDDGSGYTVTWPTMTWASGSAPTLATSGYTTVVLWHRGDLYGAVVS